METFSDSTNPLADPDFELAPEDVNAPEPEPWPPSGPQTSLQDRVIGRPDYWETMRKLRR